MKVKTVIDNVNNISFILECETELDKIMLVIFKKA